MSLLPSLAWSLAILLALAGWGRSAMRLLRRLPHISPARSWLEAPAWGIAAASLIGGLLNLASLSARPEAIAFIAAGATGCLLEIIATFPRSLRNLPARRDPILLFLSLLLTALLALRLLAAAAAFFNPTLPAYKDMPLNPRDDLQSYLVSPTRLLQTGSLGNDPFNSRSLMSALGTQHFLNETALTLMPPQRLHALDGGVGLIALSLAAAGLALGFGLPPRLAPALALIPLLVPFASINLSANLTAAAALTALLSAAADTPGLSLRQLLLWSLRLGFLLAAAWSLKTTLLFAAALFALLLFLFHTLAAPRRAAHFLLAGLTALAAAFIFLSPWMLWQFHSSGTLLYPILGNGFHAFTPNPFPPLPTLPAPAAQLLTRGLILPILLLTAALIALALPRPRRAAPANLWTPALAFLIAWTLSWPVMAHLLQMIDLPRYLLPINAAALLAAFALFWKIAAAFPNQPLARHLPLASFLALALLTAGDWSQLYFDLLPANLSRGLADIDPLPAQQSRSRLRALQSQIPSGQPILAYLANPADLDFSRNPIFVVDWPAESSPPPGLPLTTGPAPLRAYLELQGIHNILYDYASHAAFPPHDFNTYLEPYNGDIVRRQTANAFTFQQLLTQLEKTTPLTRTPETEILHLPG